MKAAHKASGAEMVTVAVNRVPLDGSYGIVFGPTWIRSMSILAEHGGLFRRGSCNSNRKAGEGSTWKRIG